LLAVSEYDFVFCGHSVFLFYIVGEALLLFLVLTGFTEVVELAAA
jgi:hypothetical protein